ncbi:MAG: LptA/OstA family protein [Candidatus Omnitrophota bacterium]
MKRFYVLGKPGKLCAVFLCLCLVAGGALPSEAFWPGADTGSDPEFSRQQKRNMEIQKILDKARDERGVNNYKRARSFGERALRLDPDNYAVKAFLGHLDIAEERWEKYQSDLKELKIRQKEEAKAQKEAEKELKREEVSQKRAEEEAAKLEERKEDVPVKQVMAEEKPAVDMPDVDRVSEDAESIPGEKEIFPKREDPEMDLLAKSGHSIVVDGDRVEYLQEEGRITAEGNVSIQYGDVVLNCDKISIDTNSRIALCEGNVRIVHPKGVLEGDLIRYDLANKEGEIVGADLKAFPWFATADETGKVGPNEYVLKNGYITTCDEDEPHYHLKAQEIRVFPNDKIIAKNVIYYIGKIPVLWVPYYYQPNIELKTKVQLIPGSTSDWGYFLLSAWRFHIKGNTKVDILSDYRTKKGFAFGANLYYDLDDTGIEGLGKGLLRGYFIDQNGFGTYEPSEFRDEGTQQRWRRRIQWKHRLNFDEETTGIVEFNKLSDEHVLKEYFYNEYEENNPVPPNYISIINTKPNYSFSLEAHKRFNDFYTVTQRLPEVKLDVFEQRLWDTPLYYGSTSSATYFEKEYAYLSSPSEKVGRADTYQKLAYATGIGPLSIVPYGTLQGTAYSRTKNQSQAAVRGTFGGGVDTFIRFSRVFDIKTDYLGLDINELRHIVAPRAQYYYTYRPSMSRGHFYQMDEIDALEHLNGIAFSLENKLQTKRGMPGEMASVDLIRSIIRTDYSFREKEGGPRFKMLHSDLEVRPYSWLYFDNRLEIETENFSVKTNSVEAVLQPWWNFQAALGYRYEKRMDDSRNQLTFDTNWVINPKWSVGLYERFDLEKSDIEEQQLTITRDLHCWAVDVVYNVKGKDIFEDDFTFWFAFRLKAFPDLPIGLSRSYNKTPPGALSSYPRPSLTPEPYKP